MQPDGKASWSTASVVRRVVADWAAGVLAAGSVAPIIATIDKAVVENSAGRSSLTKSVVNSLAGILRSPLRFVGSLEFRWIFFVYGTTYMANNSVDSLCKIMHTSDVMPKLVCVTLVNMVASILKDRAFARAFGAANKEGVKPVSILIWLVRDVLTIAGSFVIPPRLAQHFADRGYGAAAAKKFFQFVCPITFQLVLTPIHLLGYDFYNNPVSSLAQRFQRIRAIYPYNTFIRMIRMGSAYGIGGVNNITLRNYFHSRNEGPNWDSRY